MGRLPEALAAGLRLHQAGNLEQAEEAYRGILRIDPRHADALHLIGVIHQQRGEPATAVEYIGKAIAASSSNAVYHTNLGAAYQALGQPRDAENSYRRAIRLQPKHADAHFNLGVLLEQLGNPAAAEETYSAAIKLKPQLAEAHLNLGNIHKTAGRLAAAEHAYRLAIFSRPKFPLAYYNLGNLLHAADRLDEAVECYEQALRLAPDSADVLYNLGTALLAAERPEGAQAILQKAIAVSPANAPAWNNLGLVHQKLSQQDAARECFSRAIELLPDWAEAHNNLGSALTTLGNDDQALGCFRRAIELSPNLATAHGNLGQLHERRSSYDVARACFETMVRLAPRDPEGHRNLGALLEKMGESQLAIRHYEQALAISPVDANTASNLAALLRKLSRHDEALAVCERALATSPDAAPLYNTQGQILQTLGRISEAEQNYRRAIELKPDYATAWNNLGVLEHGRGQSTEALRCFRRAVELEPSHEQANTNLGLLLRNRGKLEEAERCFDRVISENPARNRVRLLTATSLSPIYRSLGDLKSQRSRLLEELQRLQAANRALDPERDELPSQFFLAYQGLNDRDVQQSVARLYPVPAVPPEALLRGRNSGERIRVGFLSHHFRNHTISHLMQGMIARLSRERFDVSVLSVGDYRDEMAQQIRQSVGRHIALPEDLHAARRLVLAEQLDLLFYADIGMDPFTNSLAFHRLAPVQCVTWGHPVTTGIPHIDYFISSELLETAASDEHYTERLVRLQGLPTYYDRPPTPEPVERSRFGLPADGHLYLCPQSLFKIHPEFDAIVGEILRKDPQGIVAFIEGLEADWTHDLAARFRRVFPAEADRVRFLPKLQHHEFLQLLAAGDVLLDPLHFGSGNTAYEGLAAGTPIVTLPSEFLRGRVTAACYRQMGMTDCVASSPSEYVDIAVRLGTDLAFQKAMRARILETCHRLYADADTLHELEDFLAAAVDAAEAGEERVTWRSLSSQEAATTNAPVGEQDVAPPQSSSNNVCGGTDNPNVWTVCTEQFVGVCATPFVTDWAGLHQLTQQAPVAEQRAALAELMRACTCPACGHHVAVPFYDGGRQPLATVAWPRSAAEARSMKRLPLTFLRCVECGHVYNRDFDYAEVPYSEKPNLMFNRGEVWTRHLQSVRDLLLEALSEQPTVVEVGCGEGHLLRSLAECRPAGRYIGFDPSNAINTGNGLIEGRRELFEPTRHLAELRPELIVSRHVLEHLMNPLAFVQAIAFAASWENLQTRLFIEVPCIDQVIRNGRTVDFFYEHNSNFTTVSLERLLSRCASDVDCIRRSYNEEVVYGLATFRRRRDQVQFASEAVEFREQVRRQRASIRSDIERLLLAGKSIAIWGGTGKAAAFINQHGLDADRFPLVVDSDPDKAGTFVPGTGQEIRFRDYLQDHPVDVVLIATQWRAGDIVLEMGRNQISCRTILLEHNGRLIDYEADNHPYRAQTEALRASA